MREIRLSADTLREIRQADPRVQSYNIEMTELVGGTFWAPYTPGQVDGSEPFPTFDDPRDMVDTLKSMHVVQPAIDLTGKKVKNLAKAFGPVIIRYSGSWATQTYYDFDGHTGGKAPEGFENVLTKDQWQNALDFARETGAQILVSVANCSGVHEGGTGAWMPDQAEILWSYTEAQGMKIDYAEFMNEPNMVTGMGLPEGYGTPEFDRDHDLFAQWLRENHPETVLVGPCAADSPRSASIGGDMMQFLDTDEMMEGLRIKPEIFSYHSYSGISERGAMFGHHYPFSAVLTEEYLTVTMEDLKHYRAVCDRYMPGADLWVTESADAACGGDTWAPTYAECFRYLTELALFNRNTKGVIFHNTLASSAYGLLEPETFIPRPQYWAALMFSRLMGTTVYDTGTAGVCAQSRRDSADGACWLVMNTSGTESVSVTVPEGEKYVLTSDGVRSQKIFLNGRLLEADGDELPDLSGEHTEAGCITLPPLGILFFTA